MIIMSSIKEYCILKICYELECGPKVHNYFGFDLLIYQDSIQFAMEQC